MFPGVKAIFGLPEKSGKICYAGKIIAPSGPEPALIYAVEGELQQIFMIGVLHIAPIQPPEGSVPVNPMQYELERRLP